MAKKKLTLTELVDVFNTAFDQSDLMTGEIGMTIRKQFGWSRIEYYGYLMLYLKYSIELDKMQQDHAKAKAK